MHLTFTEISFQIVRTEQSFLPPKRSWYWEDVMRDYTWCFLIRPMQGVSYRNMFLIIIPTSKTKNREPSLELMSVCISRDLFSVLSWSLLWSTTPAGQSSQAGGPPVCQSSLAGGPPICQSSLVKEEQYWGHSLLCQSISGDILFY